MADAHKLDNNNDFNAIENGPVEAKPWGLHPKNRWLSRGLQLLPRMESVLIGEGLERVPVNAESN